LGGILSLLGVKLNFVNFVALPITLGVGADYAANVLPPAFRQQPGHDLAAIVAETGSAGRALLGDDHHRLRIPAARVNRALRSFGLVAGLGEIACVTAALVALPVLSRTSSQSATPGGSGVLRDYPDSAPAGSGFRIASRTASIPASVIGYDLHEVVDDRERQGLLVRYAHQRSATTAPSSKAPSWAGVAGTAMATLSASSTSSGAPVGRCRPTA